MSIKFEMDADGLVNKIAQRARNMACERKVTWAIRKHQDWLMDIAAVNHSCPLRLQDMLEADDFNFAHDVFGIARHLDRKTGQLNDCFVPRCSR